MQKKRKGLWLFICSLIPGAGEMYMGFMKQGFNIMFLFWAIVGIAGGFSLGFMTIFLPIIWFYSFFNVHNLKSLPDEEFYSIEDNYILHLDRLLGDGADFLPKYRKILAILMIVFGVAILWNNFTDMLYWLFPNYLGYMISDILYRIPQIIIAIVIILAGYYILTGKKKRLDRKDEDNQFQEHYWEPYRPYQQPFDPQSSEQPDCFASEDADSNDSPQSSPESDVIDPNQPPLPGSSNPNP